MTTKRKLMTAEDLLRLEAENDDRDYELLDGEVFELMPPGLEHEVLVVNVASPLHQYVKPRGLGHVVGGPGVILRRRPDTVRAPDVCFFAAGRLPEIGKGYAGIVPDFLVEIVSPDQTAEYVQQKMEAWLRAGARLAWAVYPITRSVVVYRGLDDVRVYQEGEVLNGAPVLPDFSLAVAELFL